jgi:3-phosphoshikimate 1-carboxyvinyltransferase
LTLQALQKCGVTATEGEEEFPVFSVHGVQKYAPVRAAVEADWSQAGFYYAAQGIGNTLQIEGMDEASRQGDRKIVHFSAQLRQGGEAVLDVADCPDLVPPLAAQAALRGGGQVTHIVNAARLRIKESDRLSSVTAVLRALGAEIEELPDGLIIHGKDGLRGGATVDAHNDHRIAMMTAVAATRCAEPVTILGAECVRKSYPDFWEDYKTLGGNITQE